MNYEKLRAEHDCGDPNCAGLPEIPHRPNFSLPIRADKALIEAINFWNGYNVPVEWHVNHDGTRAIGMGQGFIWSIEVDADGTVATHEATFAGEWHTGFEI